MKVEIPSDLLAETLATVYEVGCQFEFCDGPTLEPADMRTCHRCATLAKLRVLAGEPPRRADEQTWQEMDEERMSAYMRRATGGLR